MPTEKHRRYVELLNATQLQFLLHHWHKSGNFCYTYCDKSPKRTEDSKGVMIYVICKVLTSPSTVVHRSVFCRPVAIGDF